MQTLQDLADVLHSIDSQGYGAYRQAKGAWSGPDFTFHVDWVQGDPYATPSRVRFTSPRTPTGSRTRRGRTVPGGSACATISSAPSATPATGSRGCRAPGGPAS